MLRTLLIVSALVGPSLSQTIFKRCFLPNETMYPPPNKTVPAVRIMQGGWGSMRATAWTAFLILREQMGLNASFYPGESPYWFSSNVIDPPYPVYLWEFIRLDKVDLVLELWQTAMKSFYQSQYYIDNGSVLFGGPNGEFGEVGWFIPKYMTDIDPSSMVPIYLRTNQTLRDELVAAANNSNGINWLDRAVAEAQTLGKWSFDNPLANNTWPIVWGGNPDYGMSHYSQAVTNKLHGGLNVNFVTMGSEDKLSALILDMYKRRLPFVANIYTPHADFYTLLNKTTGEIMEFVKMALPWNPSNLVTDQCFIEARCDNPTEALLKTANPRLQRLLPEAVKFFNDYSLPATAVNKILGTYTVFADENTKGNLGNTPAQLWYNTVCSWAKTAAGKTIWSQWINQVQRLDCPTDCGALINGVRSGSKCDAITGKCVCQSTQLEGAQCTPKCHGSVLNANKSIVLCSGHGSCVASNHKCTCNQGFGGDGCGTAYTRAEFSSASTTVVVSISLLFALFSIGFALWLRMNMQYKSIRALSPNLTAVMNFGVVLLSLSAITVVVPASPVSCLSWLWLTGLGVVFTVAIPMVKAYRISRIFAAGKSSLQIVVMSDKKLLGFVFRFMATQVVLSTILTTVFFAVPNGGVLATKFNTATLQIEYVCVNSDVYLNVLLVNMLYWLFLVLLLCFFTYKTRVAASAFKETQCTYFGTFFAAFMTASILLLYTILNSHVAKVGIHAAGILLVVAVILLTFYGKRAHSFYMEPERRNEMVNWKELHKRHHQKEAYKLEKKRKEHQKESSDIGWGGGLMLPDHISENTTKTLSLDDNPSTPQQSSDGPTSGDSTRGISMKPIASDSGHLSE